MTHPHKHLGSQTSQIKRWGEQTCCAHTHSDVVFGAHEQNRVNVYYRHSSKSRCKLLLRGQPQWTEYQGGVDKGCRGARPPFANESAACLQIARWKGSGSDFFQNSGSYFLSSSSCEHTYLPNFKLTAKRFFGEEKKKATKPDNCAKTQEAAALISL